MKVIKHLKSQGQAVKTQNKWFMNTVGFMWADSYTVK